MENQGSSLSGEQILANAIALAPMIRECRDEIERERRLPMRLVDAMKKAGIFRMPMPRALGFDELASGHVRSLIDIARREGLAKRYITRLTKLAFVSPSFVEAIAEGAVPIAISLQMLMDGRIVLPLGWKDQEQLFTD